MEANNMLTILSNFWDVLKTILYENTLVWLIVTAVLFINIIRIILSNAVLSKKRERDSFYFIWLCIAVLVWTLATLVPYIALYLPPSFSGSPWLTTYPLYIGRVGMVFIPPLLCLHVWRQVSYKDIHWYTLVLYFTPSVLFSVTILYNLATASAAGTYLWMEQGTGRVLYYVFMALLLAKTYLMMFNVFYQMPPHMRRSTRHMLVGISVVVIEQFIRLLVPSMPPFEFSLLATHIMMDYLYASFSIASSNNVIVTSREFAFSSLSTMVIILSNRKMILDWNRKKNAGELLLPTPKYRQPFGEYYQRILQEGQGRVSEHDKNIISTTIGEKEGHYLITTHEVKNNKKQFGYLVEISEVTKIYTVFRYLEEIALKDQMTGLFNRNAYMETVKTIITPENLSLGIVVGDVNNLKTVNDIYGHLEGDKLLRAAAASIQKFAPENAFVARVGGDEFVMLLPSSSIPAIESMLASIDRDASLYETIPSIHLTVSWGYALLHDITQPYNDVFDEADRMMYTHKKKYHRFHSSGFIPEAQLAFTNFEPDSPANAAGRQEDSPIFPQPAAFPPKPAADTPAPQMFKEFSTPQGTPSSTAPPASATPPAADVTPPPASTTPPADNTVPPAASPPVAEPPAQFPPKE